MENIKDYKLIINKNTYSISNETDSDPYTDYSPGIWAIKSFSRAIKYAREYLEAGHNLTVTIYNNAKYAKKGNEAIKLLGLSQTPFIEPLELPQSNVTNDKPQNLNQFKQYLKVGMRLKIIHYPHPRLTEAPKERITEVLTVGSTNFTCAKESGGIVKSWSYFGKSDEWVFDNTGATHYYTSPKGERIKTTRYEYQD